MTYARLIKVLEKARNKIVELEAKNKQLRDENKILRTKVIQEAIRLFMK